MNRYRQLRRARIAISLAFAVAIAWITVDAGLGITRLGAWVLHTQIVPAALAGSAIWLAAWFLITLSFGRIYCSTACPLGAAMDTASFCRRKIPSKKKHRYKYMPPMTAIWLPVTAIVCGCLLLGLAYVAERTDPTYIYRNIALAIFKPMAITSGSLAMAAICALAISAAAWMRGRILCNSLCPVGGVLAFMSLNPIYRIDIDTDKCIHCGKCEDVCKASCIDLNLCTVDNSRCVRCFDCSAVCPNEAIAMRKGRYRLSTPMMQPMTFAKPKKHT
ncbi:MAG: 4Fe-4S binding protein [Clostridium sp.]|nr:4Fe-4S binding protein [Clostridium sp.]